MPPTAPTCVSDYDRTPFPPLLDRRGGLSSVQAQHWTSTEGDGAESKNTVCLRTGRRGGGRAKIQEGAGNKPECWAQVLHVNSPLNLPSSRASFLEVI